ncbi:MAG: polysaccharide pyruvyl transferase family protein [Marinobacter sp.]|nr:polysaccharide pyruvyl transferase family protein [Marinobacter sp.]
MRDIILTTYPEKGSRNVGDNLITESAKKLVRHRVPEYDPIELFRETQLDPSLIENCKSILAPGFPVNNRTYPDLYALSEDLADISDKTYVVGCSFQSLDPSSKAYAQYEYDPKTLLSLKSLSRTTGVIQCRDYAIRDMLKNNGISASYIGDLALYDDSLVCSGTKFPKTISSIAFSIPHKPKFFSQARKLLHLIKREFPNAELYVTHHSIPNEHSIKVAETAKHVGFREVDLSGNCENLNFYQDIDIHIGYRLHGHIFFLRNRKPSFLLAEDSRSAGISQTSFLRNGIFMGVNDSMVPDKDAPYFLMKNLRYEIRNNFSSFINTFSFIDKSYRSAVRPYFDEFSKHLGWRPSRLSALKSSLNFWSK